MNFRFLIGSAGACRDNAAWSASFYTQRLEDANAVYVTPSGGGDDTTTAQAINRAQETAGQGIVMLAPGKYFIRNTIYVSPGIRLIGYGAERPVIFLPANTPGFGDTTHEKLMIFSPARDRAIRRPIQLPFPMPIPALFIPRSPILISQFSGNTPGTVTTNLYIRLAGTAPVSGFYNGVNIALSSTGAANVNITTAASGNTVSKATATVVVTPYSVTYDGQPHSATVTSITGVNGETGAAVGAVTLNTTHTAAGTYSSKPGASPARRITTTFPPRQSPIPSNKANATVVGVTPYTLAYDGSAHSATVPLTGADS